MTEYSLRAVMHVPHYTRTVWEGGDDMGTRLPGGWPWGQHMPWSTYIPLCYLYVDLYLWIMQKYIVHMYSMAFIAVCHGVYPLWTMNYMYITKHHLDVYCRTNGTRSRTVRSYENMDSNCIVWNGRNDYVSTFPSNDDKNSGVILWLSALSHSSVSPRLL